VPDFILSDVHLRYDRPERGERLARLVDGLKAEDRLVIVGDLCDFWLAARQRHRDPSSCPGLRSLASYRDRGGVVMVLAGNHDAWLSDFYWRTFGALWAENHLDLQSHGLRLHLLHGHRLGARGLLKAAMESRAFLAAFRMIPGPLARILGAVLDRSNDLRRRAVDEQHLVRYRRHAGTMHGRFDLVVFGHMHTPTDDSTSRPRLIVLGGWLAQASYLRIDSSGARLIVEPDPLARS
jgi:UDP-2,3-diacylglucosamine hydrolase